MRKVKGAGPEVSALEKVEGGCPGVTPKLGTEGPNQGKKGERPFPFKYHIIFLLLISKKFGLAR